MAGENGNLNYSRSVPVTDEADIIVAGGGPAGIAAAVSAARMGAKVYLIEQGAILGGMGTSGLVTVFISMTDGINVLVGGVGREIVQRMKDCGGIGPEDRPDYWGFMPFDAEKLKLVYDGIVTESGLNLRLYSKVTDVVMSGDKIDAVVLSGPEGSYGLRARLFVDATGDAALSCYAGVPFELGNEKGDTQAPTLCAYYTGVDWDSYERFLKETGQDGSLKKTVPEAFENGAFSVLDRHHPGAFCVGEKTAIVNAGHLYGADCITSKGLTEAVVRGRRQAQEYIRFYNRYVPGFEKAVLLCTGSVLGVRETRRIKGEYVLNVDDFLARRSFEDEIGRYNYAVDVHRSNSSAEDYEKFEKEFYKGLRYKEGESYGIPYRCLLPKGVGNLLVAGRCIAVDRGMQGSTRVMPCCFITGQAAGTAAVLCAREGIPPVSLDPEVLRSRLKAAGAYLGAMDKSIFERA